MKQSNIAVLERRLQILNMILTTYRNMNHLPGTPTAETLDYIMCLTAWIDELQQELNEVK